MLLKWRMVEFMVLRQVLHRWKDFWVDCECEDSGEGGNRGRYWLGVESVERKVEGG